MASNIKTTNGPTQPANRPRYRLGTPATNITAMQMERNTSAEPRSGSFKISTKGSAVYPSAVKNTRGLRNSSTGRLKYSAIRKINAIFANSDG